jgi:hypothetical protein
MAEQVLLNLRQSRISFGLGGFLLACLQLGLPFLGRQRITVSNERVLIESGFWTKTRDDVEIFRIRDIVMTQSFWQRLFGVGNIVIKAVEGRGAMEEVQTLLGVPDPVKVSEAIRSAWNSAARPQGPARVID